jgi:hypothetical protein
MTIQFFKTIFVFFFVTLLLISISSCHKHGEEGDTTNPVLSISSPMADESLIGAISIKGTASDNDTMHEMSIIVKKDSDGSELFKATPTVHDKAEFTINETWTPTGISAETAVTLFITVEDHNTNKTEQSVKFKVK